MNQVALAVALPLLTAFLLPLMQRVLAPLAAIAGPLAMFGVLAVLASQWQTLDAPLQLALGGFAPPVGISLYVDRLALLFALAVPVAVLLLWPWGGGAENTRRQSLTLLLAAAGAGLALSGDLFNLYVFYELAAVASYGLIAATATPAAYAAAFRYLVLSALGSILALLGIAIVYVNTGSLNLLHLAGLGNELAGPEALLAFALLLLGFGVKAELFPVNGWAAEVYGAASTRVSALLAGVVSKLALLVILRLLLLVFPSEEARQLLLLLGILGILAGEFAAWRARDMKRMLALSSVGQLGLVFVACSLPGTTGLVAGLAVALHHAVVKPGLFLLAERWGGALTALRGAYASSPVGAVLFLIFALSLVGLPPLPGFWAKWLVLRELALGGSALQLFALGVVLLGTVIEAAYLARVLRELFGRAPGDSAPAQPRLLDLGGSGLLAAALLLATVSVDQVWTGLTGIADQALATTAAEVHLK